MICPGGIYKGENWTEVLLHNITWFVFSSLALSDYNSEMGETTTYPSFANEDIEI